jgi:MFS family permease
VVFGCVNTGVLLATLVSLSVHRALPPAAVAAWGWRVAFLLGGALGLAGYPLRRTLAETPAFLALRDSVLRLPVREVVRAYPWPVLIGVTITAATAGFNGLLFALLPGYLATVLHYDPTSVAAAQTVGVLAYTIGVPAVAWLGDRMPRHLLLGSGAALLLAGSWPWFAAASGRAVPLMALLAVAGLVASLCSGVFAVLLAGLFPARMRYSGVALPYNIGFTAFSGTVPLVATAAIKATGLVEAPALVMAACAALTLLGSLLVGRFGGRVGDR